MSTFKTILTFTAGIASGLAVAYFADPKGSKVKLKKMNKELKKNKKVLDKKLVEYKGAYNDMVDKYAHKSKELVDDAKTILDNAKNTVKA